MHSLGKFFRELGAIPRIARIRPRTRRCFVDGNASHEIVAPLGAVEQ